MIEAPFCLGNYQILQFAVRHQSYKEYGTNMKYSPKENTLALIFE